MADFKIALNKALTHEGADNGKLGYNNKPGDRGGETVAGIARNMNSGWQGWVIMDSDKKHPNFPYNLKTDAQLLQLINTFYKKEFWGKINGDAIDNQDIANELLDTAINTGISAALTMAEKVLGTSSKGATTGQINNLA